MSPDADPGDGVDAALRAFRADEGRLDPATRARITARVDAAVAAGGAAASRPPPEAVPDPTVPLEGGRRRRPPTPLLAAAAVLVVLLAAGVAVVVRAGGDGATSADAPTAPPAEGAPGLDALADRVEAAPAGPVLGDPGATYAYRRVTTSRAPAGGERTTAGREEWVARDGSGRTLAVGPNEMRSPPSGDGVQPAPGSLALGGTTPEIALALPGDARGVADALAAGDDERAPVDLAAAAVDTLATAGLPPTARAGLLRFLHELGYRATGPIDPATGAASYRGPGFGGSTVTFAFDPETFVVRSRQEQERGGTTSTDAYADIRLRDDLGP